MITLNYFSGYYNLAKIVKSRIKATEDMGVYVIDRLLYIESSIAHVNFKSVLFVKLDLWFKRKGTSFRHRYGYRYGFREL